MSESSREEKLQAWLEAERSMLERLKPGTLSMSEVVQLSPREFFDGIGRGDLPSPPIGELMGFVPIEWSEERFVFQGVPDARHYNPLGTVHGGYAATLLDSCMGCAIHMHVKPGQGYTTTDLRISYVRAMTVNTGPVRAEGRITHVGRSTALAEGRIYDVDGKLYATGSTTCLILGGK
ncbi:PaaI family thioesterase [Pseudomonas sp. zfem005]|uniref:PaaI family thioesterase n=1 Tax=Pseudomonas sp. zfem005 TaxID=3078200 RepID=UPI002929103F|nr:PaaI family thioesterase [Pseudomonas sp. zfem005]MDU9414631.1 PaaI family thioesterase [Pseudomonas sp. zfem005]